MSEEEEEEDFGDYDSNLSIFMDNFYQGFSFFQNMKSHGLDACGTVHTNRKGLPNTQNAEQAIFVEQT